MFINSPVLPPIAPIKTSTQASTSNRSLFKNQEKKTSNNSVSNYYANYYAKQYLVSNNTAIKNDEIELPDIRQRSFTSKFNKFNGKSITENTNQLPSINANEVALSPNSCSTVLTSKANNTTTTTTISNYLPKLNQSK